MVEVAEVPTLVLASCVAFDELCIYGLSRDITLHSDRSTNSIRTRKVLCYRKGGIELGIGHEMM